MLFHHYKSRLIFHSSNSEPCRYSDSHAMSFSLPCMCKLHPCCPCSHLFLPSHGISHSVCLRMKTEKKEEKSIYKHHSNQYLKAGFPFSPFNIIFVHVCCVNHLNLRDSKQPKSFDLRT